MRPIKQPPRVSIETFLKFHYLQWLFRSSIKNITALSCGQARSVVLSRHFAMHGWLAANVSQCRNKSEGRRSQIWPNATPSASSYRPLAPCRRSQNALKHSQAFIYPLYPVVMLVTCLASFKQEPGHVGMGTCMQQSTFERISSCLCNSPGKKQPVPKYFEQEVPASFNESDCIAGDEYG
jgi:hypothetical protein